MTIKKSMGIMHTNVNNDILRQRNILKTLAAKGASNDTLTAQRSRIATQERWAQHVHELLEYLEKHPADWHHLKVCVSTLALDLEDLTPCRLQPADSDDTSNQETQAGH